MPNGAKFPSEQRQPSPSTVTSSDTRLSRSSTPPTDISSDLSSPTFALPVETAENVRRRQQTDAASAEIGARLLKVRFLKLQEVVSCIWDFLTVALSV